MHDELLSLSDYMFVNNNDHWWKYRDYEPFSPREYFCSFPKKAWWEANPTGWDTRSWDHLVKSIEKNPTLPVKEEKYNFDGHTFNSLKDFENYLSEEKQKRDKEDSKKEAILERLLDPYESKVQNEIVCACGKSLEIFVIPYKLVDNGNTYGINIYIEFCNSCDDFAEKCRKGRDACITIANAELASLKKSI